VATHLPDVQTRRQQTPFGQQGNGAGGGDAGDAVELLESFLPEWIAGDDLERLASESRHGALLKGAAAPEVLPDHGGQRWGGAGGVQAVSLGGAQSGEGWEAPGQRAQVQRRGRRGLPGLQRHAHHQFQQHPRVQRIPLAALHQRLRKMADRARIGDHPFEAGWLVKPQRQVQPVDARGLPTNAHAAAFANPIPRHGPMALGGVRKAWQRQRRLLAAQRHQQFLRTPFDSSKIIVVHHGLRGIGWSSGSPTLYWLLRSSLKMQAHKASDSPRLGEEGGGPI